jgi:predicted nicotinamide N-methyase
MKHYNTRQIKRAMGKYTLGDVTLDVGKGIKIKMVEVDDAYVMLEKMVEQEALNRRVERFPYWAEIWPTSLALARWFCAAKVAAPADWACELGCGLGVVGITLAKLGWRVEATDFVEDALIFTTHNARLNNLSGNHRVGYLDWRNPVGAPRECLVGSDVVYEKKNHPYLERILRALLVPGGRFYLADPQRKAAGDFVAKLVAQGYGHQMETWSQQWDSTDHQVDIHSFRKP